MSGVDVMKRTLVTIVAAASVWMAVGCAQDANENAIVAGAQTAPASAAVYMAQVDATAAPAPVEAQPAAPATAEPAQPALPKGHPDLATMRQQQTAAGGAEMPK